MRLCVVAVLVGLLLLPMAAAHAEDATLLAVVGPTPASMTVATADGAGYTVTVDQGPRPEAEWFVTTNSGDEPPVLLLSNQNSDARASGRASGDLVVTLVE